MDTIHEEIAALAVEQIDFTNDGLEGQVEGVITAYGEVFSAALEIGKVADSDETPGATVAISKGVLKLARQFGTAFKNLTDENAEAVKDAVAQIVTGVNETLVENLFNKALTFITKGQGLNVFVGDLLAPEEV